MGVNISFYQVMNATPAAVDATLPKLLEKSLSTGARVVVKCPKEERCTRLNETLWSYDALSFLPHGRKEDGNADIQPIYITSEDENLNGADILVLLSGADSESFDGFKRVMYMFEASDKQKQNARKKWKVLKDAGYELAYYANEDGKWTQKG